MFASAVRGLRLSLVHDLRAAGVRVEDLCAVLEIVADEQIGVAVAIQFGVRRGV